MKLPALFYCAPLCFCAFYLGLLASYIMPGVLFRPPAAAGYGRSAQTAGARGKFADQPVLVSYAFFQKDDIQVSNFDYFLRAGTMLPADGQQVHWAFVVAGGRCTPCDTLLAGLR